MQVFNLTESMGSSQDMLYNKVRLDLREEKHWGTQMYEANVFAMRVR